MTVKVLSEAFVSLQLSLPKRTWLYSLHFTILTRTCTNEHHRAVSTRRVILRGNLSPTPSLQGPLWCIHKILDSYSRVHTAGFTLTSHCAHSVLAVQCTCYRVVCGEYRAQARPHEPLRVLTSR